MSFYSLSVRFVNNNGKLSKKSYIYNIREDLFDDLKHEEVLWKFVDFDSYGAERFNIITDREYSNPVIIIDAKEGFTPDRPEIVKYSIGMNSTIYEMPDNDEVPWKEQMSKEFLGGMTPYKMVEEHKEYEKMATTSSIVTTFNKGTAEASASAMLDNTTFACIDYKDICAYATSAVSSGQYDDYIYTWNGCDQSNDIALKEYLDQYKINADTTSISGTVSIGGISDVEKEINNLKEAIGLRKDEKNMDTKKIFGNIQFGKETAVKMSMYGPAFKAYGGEEWTAYDKKSEEWVDVTAMLFNFDFPMFYKMPVAQDAVKTGDYIYHMNSYVRVIDFDDALRPVVEDPFSKTVKTILPTKNMFGFDFYTKLVSLAGDLTSMATKDQPFGNMLPFMLMSDSKSTKDMLPMMMLMGGQMDMSNPFMMMALCGDGKMSDMLPFMLMGQMNKKETK